jgi:hypothetical protein
LFFNISLHKKSKFIQYTGILFRSIRCCHFLLSLDPDQGELNPGLKSGLWIDQHIVLFFTLAFPSSDCVPTRVGDARRGRKENGGNPEVFRHLWTVRLQEEG